MVGYVTVIYFEVFFFMISQSATDITIDQLKQMNWMLSFPTDLNQGRSIYR